MAEMGEDEDIAFIETMTQAERRDALVWLSGFSPEGFAGARRHVLRMRELAKGPQGTGPGSSGV